MIALQHVHDIAEKLYITPDEAFALLGFYNFKVERLTEKYLDDADRVSCVCVPVMFTYC